MRKVILTYGLIAGAIVSLMMFITMPLYRSGALTLDYGEVVGYTTMFIALSMIFFGIKSFRDNYQMGTITFGKGFKVGLMITLIASVMYALAWEVSYAQVGDEFTRKMVDRHVEKLKEKGASEEELAKEKKKMAEFVEMYKNPAIRFGMTLVEIMPIGLGISLVCAAVLRKKEFLPSV